MKYTKVHTVSKSRKEYKDAITSDIIPIGSKYYWWKWRYGDIQRSVRMPTNLDKYPDSVSKQYNSLCEEAQDAINNGEADESLLESIREFIDERVSAKEELEVYFSESPIIDMLSEMIDELESLVQELESIDE